MAMYNFVTDKELSPFKDAITDLEKRVVAVETIRASERVAYSRAEAAELTSISLAELDKQIGGGKLVAKKLGYRVLIPRDSLLSWLDNLPYAG